MLNLAIVVFLAAGTVLAQNEALAVQKEDWCFSYIECYETNPGRYYKQLITLILTPCFTQSARLSIVMAHQRLVLAR